MNYFFNFNNKTNKDLCIKIIKRTDYSATDKNVTLINVPGRNGALVYDEGTYKEKSTVVECNFIDKKNMNDKIRNLENWLNVIKDYTLSFSDDPNFIFKVLKVECGDIKRSLKYKGSFSIKFTREPFYYFKYQGEEVLSNNKSFISPNLSVESEPIIKVTGSGDVTLTINNKNVMLKAINGTIHIDSTLKECYSDTFENLNNKMQGEFPTLKNGNNNIAWTGSVSSVKLIPNWRCVG